MYFKYLFLLLRILFTASCSLADTYGTAAAINAETKCGIKKAWQSASKGTAFYNYENTYIIKKVYLNMPESEFVKLFKKNQPQKNPNAPYIVSQENNIYFLKGKYNHSGETFEYNARFTFQNSLLARYEILDTSTPADVTHRLKKAKG